MLFDEIPHFVRDDNMSLFLVEKRAASLPFSLSNHNNKCHSEWSEAKWGICKNNYRYFLAIFNDFIYDNIMMSGLSPEDYNIKKRRTKEYTCYPFDKLRDRCIQGHWACRNAEETNKKKQCKPPRQSLTQHTFWWMLWNALFLHTNT